MRRKTIVAALVCVALLITMATPRPTRVGAWSKPAGASETQAQGAFSIGGFFRAIFGGNKKKKPVEKITEKDIKKFEASEVTRVADAKTPKLDPATQPGTTLEDRPLAERIQKARAFLNAGQVNEAITELTTAAALAPKSGEVRTLLGVAYDRKGWGGRAREEFEAALQDPNDQAMHLNNLGFLLYRQGYYDDSVKQLKRAAKLNPTEPKILNNLVLVQLAAEKYDDAYKTSVQLFGEFDARLKIARELAWHGREKDAIKQLEKARALQPESTEVLSRLAKLYDSTSQDEKAQSAREKLAALLTVASATKK